MCFVVSIHEGSCDVQQSDSECVSKRRDIECDGDSIDGIDDGKCIERNVEAAKGTEACKSTW